jgi:hypothetical protein
MALDRITRSRMPDTDRVAGEHWTCTSMLVVHKMSEKGASS